MSSHTLLVKNNILLVDSFNDNLKKNVTEEVTLDDFLHFLSKPVSFSADLTVEGFMVALKPFYDLIDSHFISYTGGFKLNHYYEQMLKPVNEEDLLEHISHIEFTWFSELKIYDNLARGKKETEFDLYGCYHGVPLAKDDHYYSFSLCPINQWKHYRLVLNKEFSCECFDAEEPDDDKKFRTIFKAEKDFTLYELIRYFFFELTWHGYTENIEQLSDSLSQLSANIDKENMVALDLDAIKISMLESELEEAKEDENYEGAERILNKINDIKSKKEIKQ